MSFAVHNKLISARELDILCSAFKTSKPFGKLSKHKKTLDITFKAFPIDQIPFSGRQRQLIIRYGELQSSLFFFVQSLSIVFCALVPIGFPTCFIIVNL